MKVSDSNPAQLGTDWRKAVDYAVDTVEFQRRFADAQSAPIVSPAVETQVGSASAATAPMSAESQKQVSEMVAAPAVRDARYSLNGVAVGFNELPPETQQWFLEADQKRAECDAYRAQVADDPDVGAYAKMRPYDEGLDGWAMKRLAAMDPSTAHMSPQEYYNYAGSDREKYDNLIRMAEAPAFHPAKRIFAVDLEQESKVQVVRDLRSQGKEVPKTFAEIEAIWHSGLAKQQAVAAEQFLSNGKVDEI